MFDLAAAKLRLGITGTEQDAAITAALNTALALAERYCDRAFLFKAETARFVRNEWSQLLVRRYPINRVIEVRVPPDGRALDASSYEVNKTLGIIYGVGYTRGTIEVDYEGGYRALPADLENALWSIFDSVWWSTPGAGLPPGAQAGNAGAVRSFSIDGMSIGYETGSGSGSDGGAVAWGAIPAWAVATLDLYRAETVVGGG